MLYPDGTRQLNIRAATRRPSQKRVASLYRTATVDQSAVSEVHASDDH